MTRTRIIVAHVVAWAIYILLYSTLWRDPDETFETAFSDQLWLLPPKLFIVYAALLILVPKFLLRKRYTIFFITLIALSLITGVLNQLWLNSIGFTQHGTAFWDLSLMTKRLTYINSTLLFALTAEGIRMWYEQREANEKLLKEKMAAELSLLRSQLQPHFFFNTLNNLYSLTLRQSELAPQLILQLSDMMRYIISSSQLNRVSLADEVPFIKSYIGIEVVRYTGKVKVEAVWPDNLDGYEIPPLVLFPFVENAFKHGVAEEVGSAWITINLELINGELRYSVTNSYPQNEKRTTSGIGLRNTKERLTIEYGKGVTFVTKKSDRVFEAFLSVKHIGT